MSLVNAFINQIGREIAHDVYRNATSQNYYKVKQSKKIDFNESFLNEVNEFELAAYDKVTVRQMINLIEKSKGIEPNSFDFQECYIKLDNKIDFCKQHLDKEFLSQLEELDQVNESNYRNSVSVHKNYISELIKKIESDISKDNNVLPVILSFIGFNPIYYKEKFSIIFNHLLGAIVGIPCLIYGSLMYFDTLKYHGNSSVGTEKEINDVKHIALIMFIVGTLFYLPILYGSFMRISNYNKTRTNKIDFLQKLKNYNSTLK
jgi:uncharacterized ubiquitin-like protein YukD